MPICITCSTPVRHLYTTYSKADDRSLGKGVRLTQCPNCKRFADKYVEHDFVVLFIDLVLIKPQVYRHLLFNRLGQQSTDDNNRKDKLDPSILRLGTLLILFDVYLTWARIEKADSASTKVLAEAPIITQYLFFLTLNVLATIAQHVTIRMLVKFFVTKIRSPVSLGASPESQASPRNSPRPDAGVEMRPTPAAPTGSSITTALLVSSCTKLFPILLVIWPTSSTDDTSPSQPPTFSARATSFVGYAVLLNNIEALLILLDCGYVVASALAIAGALARWLVEGFILGMVGLEVERGPVSDFMGVLGKIGG